MKHWWTSTTMVIILATCVGCGTLFTLSNNKKWPNQIYAGTRAAALGHSTQIDVPFSLVADTVVLPYTILRTIYNYTHVDTLFYEYSIEKLRYEVHGVSVLVVYSSIDNTSNKFWPKLILLASQKRTRHVGFYVYSLDRTKKDAANLVSKHKMPPFLLYWVETWDHNQLKSALGSVGVQVEEPITLPIVAVFDSKGKFLKQWNGIQDVSEIEKAMNSIDVF